MGMRFYRAKGMGIGDAFGGFYLSLGLKPENSSQAIRPFRSTDCSVIG